MERYHEVSEHGHHHGGWYCWFKENPHYVMLMCIIGMIVLGWALIGFPIWVIIMIYKMYAALLTPATLPDPILTFSGFINDTMPITGTFGY